MYYRSFRPAERRNENDVPVQYFGDSFSADAFKKKEKDSLENQSKKEKENNSVQNDARCVSTETKGMSGVKDIDNLLLLGLLFLFLNDCECKEDIIIPVLLGVILLS